MAKKIEDRGHAAILPFFKSEEPRWDEESQLIYMLRSIKMVKQSDAICLMDEWYMSSGCQMERWAAIKFGKKIYTQYRLEYIPQKVEKTLQKGSIAIHKI